MSEQVVELPGLGGSLAISLLSLGLVCLLAYVTLRWLGQRGVGRARGAAVRVVARCPLEPRRSVYVIEASGRYFLIGAGEGGMSLLAELDRAAVGAGVETGSVLPDGARPVRGTSFADVLARALGKMRRSPPAGGTP